MKHLRAVLPLALVAGLISVTAAGAASSANSGGGPAVAHIAGGDVTTPLYPAIVNVRLVRAQNLLQQAAKYEDLGDYPNAVLALTAARSNMTKAWTGAQYVIQTAPPPPPADKPTVVRKARAKKAVVRRSRPVARRARVVRNVRVVRARVSGGAIVGASPYADQYTTAAAVLSLQHAVATTAMGMIDNASEPLLTAVSKNLFAALNARDAAVAYIHSLPVPPPADRPTRARASGAPIVAGWSTSMQAVVPDIDDEMQQIDGVQATIKLSPGRARILGLAELQDLKTERTINTYWPPIPPEG
jgi:hypothetical protein